MKYTAVLSFLCILYFFCVSDMYAQLGPSDEIIHVIEEFETDDFHSMQYGMADNVHSPIVTFHNRTYFIWITKNLRPKVGKIENEQLSTAFLDKNETDLYQTHLDGHHKYSIGVDQQGYIHIAGDMHNYHESQSGYIDRYSGHKILYWKSAEPGSIDSFLFVGDSEERIPGHGFTYLSFSNDQNGVLYARYRSKVAAANYSYDGENAWSLAMYDSYAKRWSQLGVLPPEGVFADDNKPIYKTLFWEELGVGFDPYWEKSYQNFGKEVEFDFNNRMHLTTVIRNNASSSYESASDVLYAYSDDRSSFYRADGSRISSLPLRADAGDFQADIVENNSQEGYSLTGSSVTPTINGDPVVSYSRINSSQAYGVETGSFKYWDDKLNQWSSMQRCPVGGLIRHKHVLDANGVFSFIDPAPRCEISRYVSFGADMSQDYATVLDGYFRAFDRRSIREQNVIRGFHFLENGDKLKIIRVESEPVMSEPDPAWMVSQMGNSAGEAGTFNRIMQMQSSGRGLHEGALEAQFVSKKIAAKGSIVARIINVDYQNTASFGGIMISDGQQDSDAFMASVITYDGIKSWVNTGNGGVQKDIGGYNEPAEWFRLERNGDTVHAWHSDNGRDWQKFRSVELELPELVYAGLISGSGNEKKGHSRMDNIRVDSYYGNSELFNMYIYPNPCRSNTLLSIGGVSELIDIYKVDLYNFQGKLLHTYPNVKESIWLPEIPDGSYFFRVSTNDLIVNKRIVVLNR